MFNSPLWIFVNLYYIHIWISHNTWVDSEERWVTELFTDSLLGSIVQEAPSQARVAFRNGLGFQIDSWSARVETLSCVFPQITSIAQLPLLPAPCSPALSTSQISNGEVSFVSSLSAVLSNFALTLSRHRGEVVAQHRTHPSSAPCLSQTPFLRVSPCQMNELGGTWET